MGLFGHKLKKQLAAQRAGRAAPPPDMTNPYGDANAYLAALQRATYQGLSPQFTQGLAQINSNLAGSGPLADSGYGTAMKARLANSLYGAAQGQIGGGYANYLGNALGQQRQYNYARQLMAYQKKLNKRSTWADIMGILGGAGGAIAGGPAGAAAGYGIGSGAINDKFGSTE